MASAAKVKIPSASAFVRKSQPAEWLPLVRNNAQGLGKKRPDNADRWLNEQPHKRLNLRTGEWAAFVGCHGLEFSQLGPENKP